MRIASRMKGVLHDLISSNQNVRLVLDLINHCDKQSSPGALLLIDYKKAFDRLDWDFMFKTFSFFNLGPDFVRWIRTLSL